MKLRFRGRAMSAAAKVIGLGFGLAVAATASGAVADVRLPSPPAHPALAAQGVDAETIFEAAQFEFATGNHAGARRLLHGLLSRFPAHARAVEAQRMLRTISVSIMRGAHRSDLGLPPSADGAGTGSQRGLSAPEGWEAEVTVSRAPQDDLAMTSGDRVFFAPGSAALGANAQRVLRAQAEWLKANPAFGLEVAGHADEPGSDAENAALSLERAKAVRQQLMAEGISPNRVQIVGRGRSQRVALCSFPACFAQNSRAVSVVMRWSPRRGLRRLASSGLVLR
jgi:peptidoglycan-associated lipoprotein